MGVDIEEVLRFELNRAIMDQLEMKPTTRLLNLDELSVDEIKKYLQTTHTILFLDWIITDKKGLEAAAQWIKEFFDRVYIFVASEQAK